VTAPLVSASDLATRLSGPEPPLLLDVRYRLGGPPGRPDYEQAHLPGAVYVDMDSELAGTPGPHGEGGRHPMPDAAGFTAAMRRAGVSAGRPVVAYDDWSGLPASRAWWLLRYFGHPAVQVLDGGIGAWQRSGGHVEHGVVEHGPGDFDAVPGGRRLIDADAAARLARTGRLLDGRPRRRFQGLDETVDPIAGHIPGAISAPALANVGPDGAFLSPAELRERLAPAVAGAGTEVGTYCGSGIQAAQLALVLAATGLVEDAAVYAGSWSDWITDTGREVELG
jgi:thiosulfate/3-mercaptopyruvate sulfurtransferase